VAELNQQIQDTREQTGEKEKLRPPPTINPTTVMNKKSPNLSPAMQCCSATAGKNRVVQQLIHQIA
jgi:hypothetical protein